MDKTLVEYIQEGNMIFALEIHEGLPAEQIEDLQTLFSLIKGIKRVFVLTQSENAHLADSYEKE